MALPCKPAKREIDSKEGERGGGMGKRGDERMEKLRKEEEGGRGR